MALVDTARIYVKSGSGGNGSTSFRREKYVPKGGPDGGDGGRGGDVVLRVKDNLNSLLPFQFVSRYIAMDGGGGAGQKKFGKAGKTVFVDVPPGTVVFLDESDEMIADLTEPGEEFVVAKGGKGGLGNVHFKSSTRARPKIADYPFTTLQPILGVVELGGPGGETFVMADIPGLIEGAAAGHGLGHEFLRHVRRTKLLVHVLDAAGGLEGRDPLDDFRKINGELVEFDEEMARKPMIVALNKVDLVEARENLPRLRATLAREGYDVFEISAATGEGVTTLHNEIGARMRDIREAEAEERKLAAEKPRRRVYTLGNVDERAWDIAQTAPDHFVVSGVGIERFAKMTNFDQWESADRFQRVLERAGILSELAKMGVKDGDTVQVGVFEMQWGDQEENPFLASDDERERMIADEG